MNDDHFEDKTITATVIAIDESTYECIALLDGNRVVIDPFVTSVWEWEHRNNLIGTWNFVGFWSQHGGAFLPSAVIRP